MSSTKQISDLADNDLTEIFKRLPPYDRLVASEVCRRWFGLSRKAWVDVKHLDLSLIPAKHITLVIKQCPNLRSIFANGNLFDLNELACLSKSSQLSSVQLYDCTFPVIRNDPNLRIDSFAKIFGENVQQASWNELVIHNAHVDDVLSAAACSDYAATLTFSAEFLPVSLTRLQVSGLRSIGFNWDCDLFLNALDRLQNLECLILHSTPDHSGPNAEIIYWASYYCPQGFERISALKNLKELCIGPVSLHSAQGDIGPLIANLPKLEVLFLNEMDYVGFARDLEDLITMNSVLRILVLSGAEKRFHANLHTIDIPARKRFPRGFGSDPLPLLHVFVGKAASEKFRFSKSASDAAIIYPINEPMPEFLEREDIAPIFKGVWVAEKIKEAARNGCRLWEYHSYDTARSVQNIEI